MAATGLFSLVGFNEILSPNNMTWCLMPDTRLRFFTLSPTTRDHPVLIASLHTYIYLLYILSPRTQPLPPLPPTRRSQTPATSNPFRPVNLPAWLSHHVCGNVNAFYAFRLNRLQPTHTLTDTPQHSDTAVHDDDFKFLIPLGQKQNSTDKAVFGINLCEHVDDANEIQTKKKSKTKSEKKTQETHYYHCYLAVFVKYVLYCVALFVLHSPHAMLLYYSIAHCDSSTVRSWPTIPTTLPHPSTAHLRPPTTLIYFHANRVRSRRQFIKFRFQGCVWRACSGGKCVVQRIEITIVQ